LHLFNQAQTSIQQTKHSLPASHHPGYPVCRKPITPIQDELQLQATQGQMRCSGTCHVIGSKQAKVSCRKSERGQCRGQTRRVAVPYCRRSPGTSHVEGSIRENVGATVSEKNHILYRCGTCSCRRTTCRQSSDQTTIVDSSCTTSSQAHHMQKCRVFFFI
jgi:hypothetical protein